MYRIFSRYLFLLCTLLIPCLSFAQSTTLHPVKEKPAAVDFELIDIDEFQHKLSNYKGKVVILNFWATWCPPCRFELPSMERAWQQLKDKNVVMLAINIGEDADTIFTFTADYSVTFPLLMDQDSKVIKRYPVVGLPTTYIVDPTGHLAYKAIGTREWDDPKIIRTILNLNQ